MKKYIISGFCFDHYDVIEPKLFDSKEEAVKYIYHDLYSNYICEDYYSKAKITSPEIKNVNNKYILDTGEGFSVMITELKV